MEFIDVIKARRSCRKYTNEAVPASVIEQALEHALIAPNSSNMQLWKFYWVHSPENKKALSTACLNQPAASTAQELVVVVADWSQWKVHKDKMVEILKSQNANPGALKYYEKLIPLMYSYGPLNILGAIKKVATSVIGMFRPTPRGPNTKGDVAMVAVKSAALACENFMLSIYNQGFACCPMEGFDEKLVNKVVGHTGCESRIAMVISVGKADSQGIYGPQIRFDRSQFIKQL